MEDDKAFILSAREELAVVCERIRKHEVKTKKEAVKVRLGLARDLVQSAICWMESE